MKNVKVKRQPGLRTWGIYVNGQLVEGGFFSRDAAIEASSEYVRAS